jgi:hypothetical protein
MERDFLWKRLKNQQSPVTSRQLSVTNHQSPVTSHRISTTAAEGKKKKVLIVSFCHSVVSGRPRVQSLFGSPKRGFVR